MIDSHSHPLVTAIMLAAGVQSPTAVNRARELQILPLVRAMGHSITPEKLRLAAGTMLIRRETEQVQKVLHRVNHAVLKGPDLAEEIFGTPTARTSGDVDILVSRRDLERALADLQSAGWKMEHALIDLETNNQIQLIGPGLGITTEVHWAVALPHIPQPPPAYFMPEDGKMRPEPLLLYLAFHFHNHVGFMKGLLDIAAWWDRYGGLADWWEIESIAKSYGILGLISWPLRTLEILSDQQLIVPARGRVVETWAQWTANASRGVLGSSTPIRSADALGFKTHDTPIARRVGANWLSLSLIDPWQRALGAFVKAAFLGPEVMHTRHPSDSWLRTWGRIATRPAHLILKASGDGL